VITLRLTCALLVLLVSGTPQAHAGTDPAYYSIRLPAGTTLAGYDVHGRVVVATPAEAATLRSRGVVLTELGKVYHPLPSATADGTTFYGGYHTSLGHERHNAAVAAAHPRLVKLYDIGDSWLKTQRRGGHDIQALCITSLQPGDCATGSKPRFVLHAQIHAREIATGELAYRWIDLLVGSYGKDPVITRLLDTRELWVVPVANPDGLDLVASRPSRPVLQRKNADDSVQDCGLGRTGVDLNRNSSFQWDASQGRPCDDTYPGPSQASEPETAAIQGLLDRLFRDTKGGIDAPAGRDTTGIFITLHSFGNLVLAPWGFTNQPAPDRAALVALGKKLSAFNGYPVSTGDAGLGYFAPGATDDWLYGTRGVPAYTFEVGPEQGQCAGFLPTYSCLDSTLWPSNKGAFLYAARAAATPYGPLPTG
jgi:carboxypeptidase T